MNRIDVEISRYEANLTRAIEKKLPEGVINQYRQYIMRKIEEKQQLLKKAG